ncbi:hypothetical protein PybrP1_001228 [[Pythium] brassicae (nom. inval.)]|nr:hypothetical protein PybrP1_001228 [[Pythium] brassicae (nom. inval.)]
MNRYVHSGRNSNYRSHHQSHQNYRQQHHQQDTYGGSTNNNSSSSSLRFALSDSDFQRDAVLKRQRYLSPERAASSTTTTTTATTSNNPTNNSSAYTQQQPSHRGGKGNGPERPVPSSAPPRRPAPAAAVPTPTPARGRSKSKSRARQPSAAHPPKPSSSEFIALGQRAHTTNTYRATYHGSSRVTTRSRSRSVAVATSASTSRAQAEAEDEPRGRSRSRSRNRELERERAALPAPKVALAKASSKSSHHRSAAEDKPRASKSQSKARKSKSKSSRRSGRSSSSDSSSSSDDDGRRASRKIVKAPRKASAKRTSPSRSASPPRRESSRRRSKSHSSARRRTTTDSREQRKGNSESRARGGASAAASSSSTASSSASIDAEIESTQRALSDAKKDLEKLLDNTKAKQHQIRHLELDLEVLEKRKRINADFGAGHHGGRSPPADEEATRRRGNSATRGASHRDGDRDKRSVSRSRTVSRRPCIVDTDESDDDEVVILDPTQVKQERQSQKRPRSPSASRRTKTKPTAANAPPPPVQVPTDASLVETKKDIPDHFWGKADTAKLLSRHHVRKIPDGHARKMRHLAFNPMKSDYFATSSDDGGLIMWNYERPSHEISKMGTFAPSSFRRDSQCAESIAWSPDGNRLAMAFRDPLHGKGEFCVVLLHNLQLTGSDTPQDIPSERVTSVTTTLHPRGISTVEWIPSGYGNETTSRSLVTSGADHAVVLWEAHDDASKEYKWTVLHREHRSEVKAICVHSQRQSLYTGGLDGQVIRYDLHRFAPEVVMERRKPSISKINAVLEHPHNPHLLLVSCVEQAEHSILLHDLRERYSSSRDSTMTLSWVKSSDSRSMSQYIVPRWSPAGLHVSCGSTSGVVNIWDVRVRGPTYPVVQPLQAIPAHQKTVLHATWHPRYNALFTVSNDRLLGLLTFKADDQTWTLGTNDAAQDAAKAFRFEIPVDAPELADYENGTLGAALRTSRVARAPRETNRRALEERVAELEERLQAQEIRCCEHAALSRSTTVHSSALAEPPSANDQLVEFFLTELEKHQTVTTKLVMAHATLQQELHAHQQLVQRHQSEHAVRLRKYLEVMRRVEREVVHGEKLREEEKQLTTAQHKKRLDALRRAVEEQLAALQAQRDLDHLRFDEQLERKFVDVVLENQALKAENMELRGDLQCVSAMARSNKKTIRSLTDEILKLKSAAAVYPSELDELLAFRGVYARKPPPSVAAAAAGQAVSPHSE